MQREDALALDCKGLCRKTAPVRHYVLYFPTKLAVVETVDIFLFTTEQIQRNREPAGRFKIKNELLLNAYRKSPAFDFFATGSRTAATARSA
jgi:hypothetical protein